MDKQRALAVRQKMVGARLRALRMRQDLSIEECAQALGLSADGWLARELGRRPLLVSEFWRLCGYLGMAPQQAYEIAAPPPGRLPGARPLRLYRKILGAALAEGRDGLGWSRAQAATAIGMSEERLRLAELGQEELSLAEAEALADLYKLDPPELFPTGGQPEPDGPLGRAATASGEVAPSFTFAADIVEFLQRPDAERYLRAAMALSQLDEKALAAFEDALLFLRGAA